MKVTLKRIILIALIYISASSCAFATKLPDSVVKYVNQQVPRAAIRFDGLISFPDGTMYIPVLPAQSEKDAKGVVKSTLPAHKQLSDKPDMILFDTNFALLKVVKNEKGKPTLMNPDDIPFVVKTGVLPQDMLVPPGMILPDDLKIILGDLKIPLSSSAVNNFINEKPKAAPVKAPEKLVKIPEMNGKSILASTLNSNFINVIPANTAGTKFTINSDSFPKFIQPVEDDRYLLIAGCGRTFIDVADLKLTVLAKKIELAYQPSEIVLGSDKTKAYVAVADDQLIFLIDLKSMTVLEKIKIKGYPKNLALDENGQYLTYMDKSTGDIYTLGINGEKYDNKFIVKSANVSKLLPLGNVVYALSRTKNELQVVDTMIQDYIYIQDVGKKPVDMLYYNNHIYVLNADNTIHIFNIKDYTIEKILKLDTKGFSNNIVRVPGTDFAVITNASEKKYFVLNLKTAQIIQTVPTDVLINKVKILTKPIKQ